MPSLLSIATCKLSLHDTALAACKAWPAWPARLTPGPHVAVGTAVFALSLLGAPPPPAHHALTPAAVSFPALARAAPALRIPRAVFFVGRHFGTGACAPRAGPR